VGIAVTADPDAKLKAVWDGSCAPKPKGAEAQGFNQGFSESQKNEKTRHELSAVVYDLGKVRHRDRH
jgi:inosine/xanthosine triphosphate pyrophosphatase family protein